MTTMQLIACILLAAYAVVSVIAFCFYAADKKKAKKGAWRIPEATLMGVAAIGGSIGTLLGMRLFRHKTKHLKFSLGVPAILMLQLGIAVAVFLLTR